MTKPEERAGAAPPPDGPERAVGGPNSGSLPRYRPELTLDDGTLIREGDFVRVIATGRIGRAIEIEDGVYPGPPLGITVDLTPFSGRSTWDQDGSRYRWFGLDELAETTGAIEREARRRQTRRGRTG